MIQDHDHKEERDGLPLHMEWMEFDQLAKIRDGLIARMFQAAVAEIAQDLAAAPDVPAARKITLEIQLKPIKDPNGDLAGVTANFGCPTSRPKRTAMVALQARRRIRNGKRGQMYLCFNPDDVTNPDQLALDFPEGT